MKIGDKVYDSTNDKYGKVTGKMGTFLVDIEYVDGTKMLSSEIKHLSVVSNKEYQTALQSKIKKTEEKLGYTLPVGLIDWSSYQKYAEQGEYNNTGAWLAINPVNQRKAESDLKHLMFMVAQHHGGEVEVITIKQTNKVESGETTSEDVQDNEIRVIVHTPSKHVMRLVTGKKTKFQKNRESQLKVIFEGKWPEADGWNKDVDNHNDVLTHLTGYADVKEAVTKAFITAIKPKLAPIF